MSVLHLFENKQSEGSRAQTFTKNSQNEQKLWKKSSLFGGRFFSVQRPTGEGNEGLSNRTIEHIIVGFQKSLVLLFATLPCT